MTNPSTPTKATRASSASSSSTSTPVQLPIQPLHDSSKAALVYISHLPIGTTNPNPIIPGQTLPGGLPPSVLSPTLAPSSSSSNNIPAFSLNTGTPSGTPSGDLPSGVGAERGLGEKALLMKRFAKANKPSLISPTDQLQSPCTKKLDAARKKHFGAATGAKGKSLGDRFLAVQNQTGEKENDVEMG